MKAGDRVMFSKWNGHRQPVEVIVGRIIEVTQSLQDPSELLCRIHSGNNWNFVRKVSEVEKIDG
jgi:hypothetical protein